MRKVTSIGALVVAVALLGAACTVGGPAPTDWKVKPQSISVVKGEDHDGGDEPYVIQLGFRSKLGVANSSSASISSQCYARKLPATNAAPDGTTVVVPAGSADLAFPATQNLDLGDVLLKTAPLEIFGDLTFVMERDGLFPDSCAVSDALRSALVPVLRDSLNLLIAASPVPPTQEQLINLIVSHLGDFLSAIGSVIASVIEGLGNPDDIMGVGIQLLLPTAGAFTDLLNTGLAIGGLFQPGLEKGFIPIDGLPNTLKIKVGTLGPSQAQFDFDGPTGHYIYSSTISH
jgi:hypothetical protein